MPFVEAYSKTTGAKLPKPVPEAWITHPILGRDLSLLPSATKKAPAKKPRRPRASRPAPLPVHTTTDTPADGDNEKE